MQLEKLHVALQVVVLLHTYLNLPSSALVQFTAQVSSVRVGGLLTGFVIAAVTKIRVIIIVSIIVAVLLIFMIIIVINIVVCSC